MAEALGGELMPYPSPADEDRDAGFGVLGCLSLLLFIAAIDLTAYYLIKGFIAFVVWLINIIMF